MKSAKCEREEEKEKECKANGVPFSFLEMKREQVRGNVRNG